MKLELYDKELALIHELLSDKIGEQVQLKKNYFYEQEEQIFRLLVDMFDIKKVKTQEEVSLLLEQPLTIHFKEGTKASLQKALKSYFGGSRVLEWFEYNDKPYHFKVEAEVTNKPITEELLQDLEEVIELYKNVRSICGAFVIVLRMDLTEFVASREISSEAIEVMPFLPKDLSASLISTSATASSLHEFLILKLDAKGVF